MRSSGRPLRFAAYLLVALIAAFSAIRGVSCHVLAQDAPPIVYRHFNTDLALDAKGHLRVRMIQQLAFDGEFSSATFEIPTQFSAGIDSIQLYLAGTTGDNLDLFTPNLVPVAPDSLVDNGDTVAVEWSYPTTQPGDVRLFVIEYIARSVVWVYSDQDLVRWQAVNGDRSGIRVENSTVTLTLPEEIPLEKVVPESKPQTGPAASGPQTLAFTARAPLPDGVALVVEAAFPHSLLGLSAQDWQVEEDQAALEVQIDRAHSDVVIESTGDLSVRESVEFTVLDGALHYGYLSRSLLYAEDVLVDEVRFNGKPLGDDRLPCFECYSVVQISRTPDWVYLDRRSSSMVVREEEAGRVDIDWTLAAPLPPGESGRLDIAYRVQGALRIAPDSQFLTWPVIPDHGLPATRASLRLVLPPGAAIADVSVEGPPGQGSGSVESAGTLYYTFDGTVLPGGWQIAIDLPAGATSAQVPAWQTDLERILAEVDAAAVARARRELIQKTLGILALIAAALGGVVAWFRGGRRRVRESLGGFISEPPSDLSPALVEYLVERKATENGILGSMFHLAALGLLQVQVTGDVLLRRTRKEPLGPGARSDGPGHRPARIAEHLRLLHDAALWPALKDDEWTSLNSLAPALRAKLPEIYASLAREIQQQFIVVPAGPRLKLAALPIWPVAVVAIVGGLWLNLYGTGIAFVLGIASAFVTIVIDSGVFGRHTRHSTAAEEQADQWRRFRTYLADIKRYGDQGEARNILDRYMGYAIALGIVDRVLAFATINPLVPPQWLPTMRRELQPPDPRPDRPRLWDFLRPETTATQPSAVHTGNEFPDFAEMSTQLGSGLRNASADLGALLRTAAGDASGAVRTVSLESRLGRRELTWQPDESVSKIIDDLMSQGVRDAREIQARDIARRQQAAATASATRRASSGSESRVSRSSGGFGSRSRSSGGFSRSSPSRSTSRSSTSRPSSSRRSGGGGRSGFR